MLKLDKEAADAFGAFPLGNGRLGAMVFGGVARERVLLNEDTLWSGHPVDRTNPEALPRLEEVRRLLFAGENYKAQKLIEQYMLGELSESYMPMGELQLDTMLEADVSNYCHALSMEKSVATVSYHRGYGPAAVGFTRRAYVSMPDDVLVMEWEAEKEGTLVFEMSLTSHLDATATAEGNTVRLLGQCPDHVVPNYRLAHPNPVVYDEGLGLRFCVEARVYTDGTVIARGGKVKVANATRCVILCNSRNNWKHPDYVETCAAELDAAAARMGDLYDRHVADFSAMYNRTTLRLGGSDGEYDMVALVEAARRGEQVLPLYEMLFAYGRYLSMTSSRQGLPANLQGIWNWDVRPAWSGNYTTNINLPMNYWHVESCGLPECGEQLALWLETVIPEGEKVAKDYFGCDGWCMNHNADMWGKMTPTKLEARFGLWPLAGVWLCQHVYNHYRYTMDKAFLRDHALPIMNQGGKSRVKEVFTKDALSVTRTMGIFSAFTYECHMNGEMPDLYVPSTAAHEYAHFKGFAREDEANFIAWYVSYNSDNADYAYSGVSLALLYAMNSLYSTDKEAHAELYYSLHEGILRDWLNENAYWEPFRTDFSDKTDKAYETYLKSNKVSDGTKSYGRMLDLILAMQREGLI